MTDKHDLATLPLIAAQSKRIDAKRGAAPVARSPRDRRAGAGIEPTGTA